MSFLPVVFEEKGEPGHWTQQRGKINGELKPARAEKNNFLRAVWLALFALFSKKLFKISGSKARNLIST